MKVPPVHLTDFISEAAGHAINICSSSDAAIDFVQKVFTLLFRGANLEHTIQIVIRPVVMNIVATKVAVLIHIPGRVVILGVQAVADIAAEDFPISAVPPGPEAEVGYHQNGLRELDIEVHSLIVQIVPVDLQHLIVAFVF